MLVIQYRPPLDKYTVEWPAGLVDEGETVEEAATREMREETGLEGRILETCPVVSSDPGMTDATLQLIMMECQLKADQALPSQRLDDGELIERVVVPLSELYDRLVKWSQTEGYMVAGKLFYFAAGMRFAKTSGYI